MSAIFGYIGKKDPPEILAGGIAAMQRGGEVYGVTLKTKDGFQSVKTVGSAQRLREELPKLAGEGFLGIAATAERVRCVGAPSTVPAVGEHFAAVCGGQIYHFSSLRRHAAQSEAVFTDDDLLLLTLCDVKAATVTERLQKTAQVLGAPTFAFISAAENALYAHSGGVLFAGYGEEGVLLSSELAPLVPYCDKYTVLYQGESVRLRSDKIVCYDAKMHKIKKTFFPTGGRVSFEPHDVPPQWQLQRTAAAAAEVFSGFVKNGKLAPEGLKFTHRSVEKLTRIILVGEGASYAAALHGAAVLDTVTDIPSYAFTSGAWMCAAGALEKNALLIAISHGGETAETLACVRRARTVGMKCVGITGSRMSALAFLCDMPLITGSDFGSGAPSSYAFSAMAVVLAALHIGVLDDVVSDLYLSVALKMAELLSGKIAAAVKENPAVLQAASIAASAGTVYTCGYGVDFAAATEAARALREMAQMPCTALPPAVLTDFPTALLQGSCALLFCSSKDAAPLLQPRLSRLKVLGARVVLITTENTEQELEDADAVISISDTLPIFHPLPCVASSYRLAAVLATAAQQAQKEKGTVAAS